MNMLLQPRSDVAEFRTRYRWMALIVFAMFLTLVGRLFQLQVLEGAAYRESARENIIRRVTMSTTRGVIRDAYGRILASSRPAYGVHIIPGRVFPSARPKTRRRRKDTTDSFPRVADALRLNPEERTLLETRIREACATDDDRSPCWRPILVREDVSRDIVAEIRQHPSETTGAEIVTVPARYYPYKNVASHLLGYVGEIDKERLDHFRPEGYSELSAEERQNLNPLNYDIGDIMGATGIERSWESHLRGQRGWEKRVVDAHGRYRTGPEATRLIEEPGKQEPIPGRDLRLTVDIDLTTAIEKAMRVHLSGAVVVVDVRNGRILSMYSKPDYDPNDLSGGGGRSRLREAMNKLARDSLRPLLDKTMTGAFQPGSTFKPFSALAALEKKRVDPERSERCEGFLSFGHRIFRCSHVHGRVNMREAIAESCNVYFFNLAQAVDLDPIAAMATEFGLGQKTGLGINPEAAGNIPTRSWYSLRYHGQFRTGFTLNTSIGQGATTVTPLSLALSYAALANGGTVYIPQIVRAVETAEGSVAQDFAPRVRQKAQVAPENLARIVEGLHSVVNDPRGTAYPVRDPYLDISGKTGTAQTGYVANGRDDPRQSWYYSRDHAWFAAFAPSKAPEIAVVVLVEHGGSGPTQAAPVAMQIVREYTRLQAVRNQTAPPPALPKAGNTPANGHGGHH
jgi:penicillin-binding protein 2